MHSPLAVAVVALFFSVLLLLRDASGQRSGAPPIPRTWDEQRLASMELPNAATGEPAKHVDAAFYYSIPATTIYRTYAVYHPDHEPEGYLEELRRKEPEVVFAADELTTERDWIGAGEHVFYWPKSLGTVSDESRARFRASLAAVDYPITKDGIIPFFVYTVREKGRVESGRQSCAMCHTRVMPDGTTIIGAQGNIPFDRDFARSLRQSRNLPTMAFALPLFGMPHVDGVQPPFPADSDTAAFIAALEAIPPGVLARHGSSAFAPVQIPDLIGLQDRKYLDRTGLVRHRDEGDLMRYSALNQDLDRFASWRGFVPVTAPLEVVPDDQMPPDLPPRDELRKLLLDPQGLFRYSDAQLYALAKFVYSLAPPANPNPYDARARRGQEIFGQEGCKKCHPAPLYTSNQLTPASGFEVPDALRETDDIRSRGVGTDPMLTLSTRRGTGFYKVPSLKGVWYRGPFSHDGSVATLEDWFDPRRLGDDYVPTGWNPGGKARPVPGHEFGLDLDDEDRRALIGFLRTL